jgi:hypothetical protein
VSPFQSSNPARACSQVLRLQKGFLGGLCGLRGLMLEANHKDRADLEEKQNPQGVSPES